MSSDVRLLPPRLRSSAAVDAEEETLLYDGRRIEEKSRRTGDSTADAADAMSGELTRKPTMRL